MHTNCSICNSWVVSVYKQCPWFVFADHVLKILVKGCCWSYLQAASSSRAGLWSDFCYVSRHRLPHQLVSKQSPQLQKEVRKEELILLTLTTSLGFCWTPEATPSSSRRPPCLESPHILYWPARDPAPYSPQISEASIFGKIKISAHKIKVKYIQILYSLFSNLM